VRGNASKNAKDLLVSSIVLADISPFTILQKMQSILVVYDQMILNQFYGSTISAQANPSPNFIVTIEPGSAVQFLIVLGIMSCVST